MKGVYSLKYEIISQNQWLYPDSVVSEHGQKTIRLHTAKLAYISTQILLNDLEKDAVINWECSSLPEGVSVEVYRLADIWVEKNTGPISFCVTEEESATGYTTRPAPFNVYDALEPVKPLETSVGAHTEGLYLSFFIDESVSSGTHAFDFILHIGTTHKKIPVSLKVYDVVIPRKSNLYISNWFGTDNMAQQHGLEKWSEEHWEMIRKYALLMRRTRQTHFLIPREILEVEQKPDGTYVFHFERTKRLITLFLSLGFTHIEGNLLAHRIDFKDDYFVVDCCGKTVRALSPEGYDYLSKYLIAWKAFLEENGWLDLLHQHVADEPTEACAQEYRILSGIVRKYLPGVPLMEAVETYDLDGSLDIWIPKNNYFNENMEHFERVRKNGDQLWFYTCCFPGGYYLNRLWDMPLIRTRLLHWGNYRYDLKGYLHWGLNFCDIDKDPFHQEDLFFPPGDTHITYPGGSIPWGSMRLEAMRAGVQDYELFYMLAKHNRPLADELCRSSLEQFDRPNEDVDHFESVREKLLRAVENLNHFESRLISPLEKVFPDEELPAKRYEYSSALIGEYVSFQAAYKSKELLHDVTITIQSDIKEHLQVFKVGLVPSNLPNYKDHDDDLLRTDPGLYPDPLYPGHSANALPGQWQSFWLYLDTKQLLSGKYNMEIHFEHNGQLLSKELFVLEIVEAALPSHGLIHTEWFYLDCLATHHQVEMLSDDHFDIIEAYLENYVEHGMNMILTPLFSPPLEMEVGGDRPTVQLVGVKKTKSGYEFDFSLLKRFMEQCITKGIQYFEMSHLFTQWGAAFAPKIMCEINGIQQKLFGWHTRADSEEYRTFLNDFVKELQAFLLHHSWDNICYFHISDEPNMSNMESYQEARAIIKETGMDFPIMDALSDYAFYQNGLVDIPVASTEHIGTFLENKVENLWAYYCCCEYKELSNRFFNMSGSRTRVIGLQLYKAAIKGFLHWGYNHWYSQKSKVHVNPYQVTDALGGFPSGDAFLVYPGDKEPVSSIRLKLIQQAFQDIAACVALENLAGREAVECIIDEVMSIDFTHYPRDDQWMLSVREKINMTIRSEILKLASLSEIN
jgi:hypothetical protein